MTKNTSSQSNDKHQILDAPRRKWKHWVMMLITASIMILADQASKHWADNQLRSEHNGRLTVVDGFFSLTYVRNPGAAWGLFAQAKDSFRRPFFLVASILAIAFIFYMFFRIEQNQHLMVLGLSLIMGGAIGNFIDRLRFEYVIDFLDFHVNRYKWPTFNVADIAITVGVLLLFLDMILGSLQRKQQRETDIS
ncbi:MAG: signal peptidase II [Pseudomonadota bacterium]